MTLHYGYTNEVKIFTEKDTAKKIFQYMLVFPKTKLNTGVYAVRHSSLGYKYISMLGITPESTITLLTHSFSTTTGNNISSGVYLYSFEFLDNYGNYSYFNIEEIDISSFKVPISGKKFNMFTLNKTSLFPKTVTQNLKFFSAFSLFLTQKSGTLSNDTSELEIIINF